MAIVKVACKCYHCKATLEVGTVAKWLERTAQGNGHLQQVRSLGYVMVCADEQTCNARLGQAYTAKQASAAQVEAQATIDMLREMGNDAAANALVGKYASQGVIVK